MIKSMTGYGRSEIEIEDSIFHVEIKTLNSRYRDIILKMPQDIMEIEMDIRRWISERINRGRVEVYIRVEPVLEKAEYEVILNEPLARAYMDIFKRISELYPIQFSISMDTFCHLRDVIVQKQKEKDMEKIKEGLKSAICSALDSVQEMRKREGEILQRDIVRRLEKVKEEVDLIKEKATKLVEIYRDRLKENMGRLLKGQEIDQDRLMQEIAFLAERSDITEEIVRLESHISQFFSSLETEEPVGRRLDFLIQEMNRETNTIGAKSQDVEISRLIVDIKSEIEKIREQVQNIE